MSAESRARRGIMLQDAPVALLATVCRCRLKRSFESRTRTRQRTVEVHGPKLSWNWLGPRRGGRHLEYNRASVLFFFNRSLHVVKYLCKVVIAVLSLRGIVSGRQNWDRRAVSSAYKVRWVCGGRGMSERRRGISVVDNTAPWERLEGVDSGMDVVSFRWTV